MRQFSTVVLLKVLLAGSADAKAAEDCVQKVRTDGQWLLQQHSRRGQFQSDLGVNSLANLTPSELMPCPGATLVTSCMSLADYDAIVSAVRGALESLPAICTASNCPQADWAACVLRMAGHDFMDFAAGQGGSDACTDMADPDNGGLPACLATGEHGIALLDIYQQFCVDVSLADFLVIAAEAVILSTRARHIASNPTAPPLNLRSSFRFGRVTATSCDFAAGRLPNPERGCQAVEDTFVNALGLSWTEAAALMGVHTLGRADVSNSGYHGWWSDPENSRQFNNNYYVSLLAKGWIPELAVGGNSGKNQWERSDIGRDTTFDGHEMMLNTDLCLAYSENGPVIATEHDCCAWLTSDTIADAVANNGGEYCGGNPGRGERGQCCGNQNNDCGNRNNPSGPAADAILRFAADEAAWLESFTRAWLIATENGHAELRPLGSCTTVETTEISSTETSTTTATTTTSTTTTTTTSVTTAVTTTTAPATTATTATSATSSFVSTTSTTTPVATTSTTTETTTTTLGTTVTSTTTTTGLQLLRGFTLVDGIDRACEGDGDTAVVAAANAAECQEKCRDMDGCRGVSFAAARCELWADRIQETVPQAGSLCLRFRRRRGKGGRDS